MCYICITRYICIYIYIYISGLLARKGGSARHDALTFTQSYRLPRLPRAYALVSRRHHHSISLKEYLSTGYGLRSLRENVI